MDKRTQIREGLAEHFQTIFGSYFSESDCKSFATIAIKYLHSQGVVLKVDRELPQIIRGLAKEIEYEPSLTYEDRIVEGVLNRMLKAGYVATEPLVEE